MRYRIYRTTPSVRPVAVGFQRKALFALLLLVVMATGCAKTPYTNRSQFILLSTQQELALGHQASRDVLKKETRVTSGPQAEMVSRAGKRIAAVAERPDFTWEFHTIKKDDMANAFCLPGGKIFVYTGLFKYAANEDELAAVIAHEVGHAIARHGAERVSTAMAVQAGTAATAIALGTSGNSHLTGPTLAALGAGSQVGIILPFSRHQETEADHIGLILMAKAGYDPSAALSFWGKFAKQPGKRPPEFLSTHPASEKRIAYIRQLLPAVQPYYEAAKREQ